MLCIPSFIFFQNCTSFLPLIRYNMRMVRIMRNPLFIMRNATLVISRSIKLCLLISSFLSLLLPPASADTGTLPGKSENNLHQYSYEIINVYPHDPGAFTQGLIYEDGYLYESTGRNGLSSLRKLELETGKVLRQIDIDKAFFAEGLASHDEKLVQLSWKAGSGFIYDRDNFNLEKTFRYPGEGWGLTKYRGQFIMSDGTSSLRIFDPETFNEIKSLPVALNGTPVKNLNELEMVNGSIFANVWQTDKIVIISPQTGHVKGVVNLSGLLDRNIPYSRANVLNGIAYDPEGDRLFVTGKLWPKLFEIKLVRLN